MAATESGILLPSPLPLRLLRQRDVAEGPGQFECTVLSYSTPTPTASDTAGDQDPLPVLFVPSLLRVTEEQCANLAEMVECYNIIHCDDLINLTDTEVEVDNEEEVDRALSSGLQEILRRDCTRAARLICPDDEAKAGRVSEIIYRVMTNRPDEEDDTDPICGRRGFVIDDDIPF